MSSWQFFAHLIPFWAGGPVTPVFVREAAAPPLWARASAWVERAGSLPLALGALLILAALWTPWSLVAALLTLIVVLAPSLLAWSVPLALTLGPLIVRERERGTWEMLRITPLPTDALVLSKLRGAMWRLRLPVAVLRALWLLATPVIGALTLVAVRDLSGGWRGAWPFGALCGISLALLALMIAIFWVDRMQQFTLMAAAALSTSATARSSRLAVPGANALALLAWLLDSLLGLALINILPQTHVVSFATQAAAVIALGPAAGYLAALPLGAALGAAGITLLLRELAIRAVWQWTLRAAQEL